MAGSTGPNLDPARRAVERLMDDECVVIRDASEGEDHTDDDELDQETGALVPPDGDVAEVYAGKCFISAPGGIGIGDRLRVEGGVSLTERVFQLSIPMDSPVLKRGDLVRVTASRRNSHLVDQEFRVRDSVESTFSVSHKWILERRTA